MQWEGNYATNLGPWMREPAPSEGFWAYIDVYDLADAIRLAAEAATPGHEVVYIASPDIASHEPLEDARAPLPRRRRAAEIRPSDEARPNGISIAKARRLLGYDPQRSWRDYLDDDGRLRPEARERLERGETGVQRGRRLTGVTRACRVALDEARGRCAARAASAGRPRRGPTCRSAGRRCPCRRARRGRRR